MLALLSEIFVYLQHKTYNLEIMANSSKTPKIALTRHAFRIQNILKDNNLKIVEGPNCGNVPCLWLVEEGQPYYKGVYISKV